MHKNTPFLLLLICITGITLWFGARAGAALFAYSRLNSQGKAHVDELRVYEGKGDRFQIIADYTFESAMGPVSGRGVVGPVYKNPWSAEKGLERAQAQEIDVWFNAKRPQVCSLRKVFPMKITLSASVLAGLLLYFVGLGLYVGGQRAK